MTTLASEQEAISEAASKNSRGRPRVQVWEDDSNQHQTRRTKQNEWYMLVAGKVLLEDKDRFAWLIDPKNCRSELLAELGRWDDPDAIRKQADRLCVVKPKTKPALASLRRYRLAIKRGQRTYVGTNLSGTHGLDPPDDTGRLTCEIVRAVNDYYQRHPETTYGEMEAALLVVARAARRRKWRAEALDGDGDEVHT